MKRLLFSLAGGFGVFLLSLVFVYTLTDVLKFAALARVFDVLVTWPYPLVSLAFPPDIEGKVSFDAVIVSWLLQILSYSLLVYAVLRWFKLARRWDTDVVTLKYEGYQPRD